MVTERWASPQEALTAAVEFCGSLQEHELVEEVHFVRAFPAGDFDAQPYWRVELRVTRLVFLGGARFVGSPDHSAAALWQVRKAFEYAVSFYSNIDRKDWANSVWLVQGAAGG